MALDRGTLVEPLPRHVAIIMDGNTRWAAKRDLPSKMGHKEGVKKAREAVEFALENNIPYLTLFAFSTENWLRDEIEVKDLISISLPPAMDLIYLIHLFQIIRPHPPYL